MSPLTVSDLSLSCLSAVPHLSLSAPASRCGEFFAAIRISSRQRVRMARQKRDTKAILEVIERSGDRSDLFWWMVEQHDEIIKKANGKRINWPSLCAEAARRGRMDRLGQPPSVMTAKKTWQRARKEVEKARAVKAAEPPRPVYPSRMDKEWQPGNAPPPAVQAERSMLPVVQSAESQNEVMPIRRIPSHEKEPFDPKKQMARLRRIINERSGR